MQQTFYDDPGFGADGNTLMVFHAALHARSSVHDYRYKSKT